MGLDVYVGTLTRYYGGEWDTIVQQMSATPGTAASVPHSGDAPNGVTRQARGRAGSDAPPQAPDIWLDRIARWLEALSNWGPGTSRGTGTAPAASSLAIGEAVAAWQAQLNEHLAGKIAEPLDWDESDTAPYFTDKPAWVGYASLLLLAAHDEHPELPRPTEAIDDWTDDPAWKAVSQNEFASSRYSHLMSASIWLPCVFAAVFSHDDVMEDDEVVIGSSVALLAELRALNTRTYHGSEADLSAWLTAGPHPDPADLAERDAATSKEPPRVSVAVSPFDHTARFALALFLDLAEKSVAHRLPMKLDW